MREKILNESGMTLIEIMVVVAIIGVIGAISAVGVMGRFERAKVKSAETQIKNIESALSHYRLDNGSYPSTEQGLGALVKKPVSGKIPTSYPSEGYLEGGQMPADPWGNEFTYSSPGIHGHPYEITSMGADGQEGGDGNDSDINSWEIGRTKEP